MHERQIEEFAQSGIDPRVHAPIDGAVRHLAAVGLPTRVADYEGEKPGIDRLMELIAQDKKVKRGALTFILVRGIGKAFVTREVEAAEVRSFLAEKLGAR